eukprot:gene5839-5753_t
MNIEDAYECDMFNKEVDKKTGLRTKTILCLPIHDDNGKVVAVMQLINKLDGDVFNKDDENFAVSFGSFIGIPLNNARLKQKSNLADERSRTLLG